MKIIWKPVVGHENRYEVSNDGQVRNIINNHLSKVWLTASGYPAVKLMGKNRFIHRLIMEAFVPNPEGKEQVNHIDGIKTNSVLDNLEWCSRKYNADHAVKLGLQGGEIHGRHILTKQQVDKIRKIYKQGGINQTKLGLMFGVARRTISDIIIGRTWSGNYQNYRDSLEK